ncbi:putative thiol peroxidase [Campylobacterota bacterium]|nr:putative thiol peroxidase [Campylobacterota bacterium]
MAQQVTFKSAPVLLAGNMINIGDLAPKVDLVGTELSTISVGGAMNEIQMIIAVPSLDTAVCATQARNFNTQVSILEGVRTTVVSRDLPFAQKRFCSTECIERLTIASDFRGGEFGRVYGIELAGSPLMGLLARAIFIVGRDGRVIYKEIVSEITNEPSYDAALLTAQKSAKELQ